MVQAIINIDDRTNQILNIIKAKFNLKDKSEAIEMMSQQYEECVLEPELKPEYVEKMKKRQKEATIKVKDFSKHFGLN
jgi:mannitol/fructose-specific phosphotransferase system IIA component